MHRSRKAHARRDRAELITGVAPLVVFVSRAGDGAADLLETGVSAASTRSLATMRNAQHSANGCAIALNLDTKASKSAILERL
jgi:hypothetical protein